MPHPGLLDLFSSLDSASKAIDAISCKRTPVVLTGAQGYARTFYAASIYSRARISTVLIHSNPEEAVVSYRELRDLLGPDKVFLFPAAEVMPFELRDNRESICMRISALSSLASVDTSPVLVVMPAYALMRKVMPKERFREGCTRLTVGEKVEPETLIRKLVRFGYERVYSVEAKGEAALRGGILDVFPPTSEYPYRIEFFGDEIDSIRVFDCETQVSSDMATEAYLVPAQDLVLLEESPDRLVRGEEYTKCASVFDYFADPPIVLVDGYDTCCESLREFEKIGTEIASARIIAGAMESREASVYFPAAFIESKLRDSSLLFASLPRTYERLVPREIVEADTRLQVTFAGRWQDMVGEIKQLLTENHRVVLLAGNEERRTAVDRWLAKEDIEVLVRDEIADIPQPGIVTLSVGSGQNGFNCPSLALCVFTENELYGKPKVRRPKRRAARIPLDWRELAVGDYVVHANHGVGQFMGIKSMTVNDAKRDYIHIRYAEEDALYVPLDQVDMIEKYVGPEGSKPRLQRLGSGEWQRIKARVNRSIQDMARRLLVVEAQRKSRQGHAYSPDTPWQREFEESFEYEDTEDQIMATQEIKEDMQRPYPMDRLLCGDVGYGKTEVAMRATFKAVMESKQVAVLVPTTILAEQHYATFSRRFAGYPVSVEVLSRFRTPAEQKKILNDVALGAVDVVIGTHRLLSKDVKFKDLGLLIVDEEHRFGVADKEKLKQMSVTCDVLTLTATPIPRTLNMAITGIRDVSLIETPPEGRFPVETYVIPYDPALIAQAIRREMRRGGQVFYVHNRVQSIARVVQRIQSYVPEARIAVAHGQMRERDLAITMQDFLQGQYDVLVSTTIIESGLDLPNVNTLVVEDSDKLGLAQLYQLRGRVGRSNRIAYAFFTYRRDRMLTQEAEQRLVALRDFGSMGSGFRLAMQDLEIRGAGNLLGPEQHGFMTLVGYDMYVRLLDQAVRRMKGEPVEKPKQISAAVEIPCDAYIPESYVLDSKERFAFYKRIAGAQELNVLNSIESELEDRYGDLPRATHNLLDVARLKIMCASTGMTEVSYSVEDVVLGKRRLAFKVEVPHLFPFEKIQSVCTEFPGIWFDAKFSSLNMILSNETPDGALKTALKFARRVCSN
ncbi:MAG: transcription-repair coupling factor [Firmicutes bacterium]|nr:transcription-repair coupling factor [Candidatus Fermentithermobacillaceae bacterium]